jgi:hypothetical protein
MKCTWAQPSGVTLGIGKDLKKELFIADSESSCVRSINLTDNNSARTLIGGDGSSTNLFCYGDKDGEGIHAKLQHPIGVHYIEEIQKVVVADSYNQKIKLLNPVTNEIHTIYGTGESNLKDGKGSEACFMEPTGMCHKYYSNTKELWLYIADSSNDAIRTVLLYKNGEFQHDSTIQTIEFKEIPSVVEVVKSNMVECGENGCKWVRKGKKNNKTKKLAFEENAQTLVKS